MIQTSPLAVQADRPPAANGSEPFHVYMGWQIFLSRVFRERTDKGMWLHWYHPADHDRSRAVRYGYFIAPDQTLEEALYAVYQSIEASIELESMEQHWSAMPVDCYSM
ncbi:MAG: hypothetical protein KME45_27840 [Stenomitos rutilans HA7619-LM2]|jgi:hypothetical protein|nr:hypothetical protein [Stenomitos rutilans HA7619-LM2]